MRLMIILRSTPHSLRNELENHRHDTALLEHDSPIFPNYFQTREEKRREEFRANFKGKQQRLVDCSSSGGNGRGGLDPIDAPPN